MKKLFIKTQACTRRLKATLISSHLVVASLLMSSTGIYAQSPGGVPGAMVWLKANSGTGTTTNGAAITSWTSQPGVKAFTGNATYYDDAVNYANFNPVVRFNGSTDVLINNTVFGTDPIDANSTFLAAKILGTNTSNTSVLWGSSDVNTSVNRLNVHFPNGGTIYYDMGNAVAGGRITYPMTPADYNSSTIWTFRSGTTVTSNHQILKSGTVVSSTNTPLFAYSLLGKDLRIGSSISDTQPWNGNLFEAIVYEKDLTTLERQQVETYLAVKYGKTLPYDYVSSDGVTIPYTVAGYGHNIAGLGRDDTSLLYQKQSQSANPGIQVMMTLGTAPQATNAANAGAIGLDRRYLMWGDDNAEGTTSVASVANVNTRLSKWWKLENVGSIQQAVTLLYPVSEFSAYPAPYFIRNTSASTASATATLLTATPITVNSVDYYSLTIPWGAGSSYFTFGGCLPLAVPTAIATQPTCVLTTGAITVSDALAGQTFSFDNGTTFQASNTKSGLAPGTYQVITKDACTVSLAASVTVNAVPATCCEPAAGTITLNP
ncbi:MAG: hypothetical protein JWQ74_3747 [Marmoricola sp.]|nr:hypothetical protein [Marmoricola sp.]